MKLPFAVQIEHLEKSFRGESVLRDITHEFETKKIHGIVGYNGSGKTVMLKCICGFLKPDKGTVIVEGKRIGGDTDFPESVGMIIEAPGFLPYTSGYQNLKKLAGLRGKIDKGQIKDTMQRVGLDPNSKKLVRHYSLGMRARLGIAQAIMEEPRILVLDEPFNGLDKAGVREIYLLLLELKEKGTTILIADHNIMENQNFYDTICEMESGKLRSVKQA